MSVQDQGIEKYSIKTGSQRVIKQL